MRKLVLVVLGLLALVTALRAYPEDREEGRFILQPGRIDLADSEGEISVSFGFLEGVDREPRLWSVFPMRLTVASGDVRAYLALNGFSIVTRRGISVGVPLYVGADREADVVSVGGEVEVDAAVQGSVWVLGADLRLTPDAHVSGNVVCLGGEIIREEGSKVAGSIVELERVHVPLVGFLTTAHAVDAILLLVEGLRVGLFLIVFFLLFHFAPATLGGAAEALAERWRSSVVYGLLSLIAIPLLGILLVLSRAGILFLPLLVLLLMSLGYWGFVAVTLRLGSWLGSRGYVAGLVGFVVISAPSLLAALLGLILPDQAERGLAVVRTVGGSLYYVACLWGLGGTLASIRARGVSARAGTAPSAL